MKKLSTSLKIFYALVIVPAIFLQACGPTLPDDLQVAMAQLPEDIDYSMHIKPLLSDRCFACHGPDEAKREAGLRLDIEEEATAALVESPGKFAIVPGRIGQSEVFHRILSSDPEQLMPPPESNLSLTTEEKALLLAWIKEGATYKPHWAFTPPQKPDVPEVKNSSWPKNEVDHFILKSLEERNWQPATPASRDILLRRISFDLTGLPPTEAQWQRFMSSRDEDILEQLVDEFLASPQFGERTAVDWLDLSRYADTHGYTVDRYRDMSPWRDWVIKALNENMPYDQFVTWQLAGDLMDNPTREQKIATAFNRNHQQNMEGGIIDEEFRVEYVVDRTNTLGTAFLGLTVSCARCHDHKYDPISQKEYYQLFSFFNQVNEAGQIDFSNATPVPTLLLTTPRVDSITQYLDQQINDANGQIANARTKVSAFDVWLKNDRKELSTQRWPEGLVAYFNCDQTLKNNIRGSQIGVLRQQHIKEDIQPNFGPGKKGQGLHLDGDAWLDLGKVGVFDRHDPFSVSVWVNIPKDVENGVIFHKGDGAALYNFRGYHMALKNNRIELLMACTTPNNAIIKYAEDLPRDAWSHVVFTYDGTGTADGLKYYLNGVEQVTETEVDNLYKSILFDRKNEPGLQFGARWRGVGIGNSQIDEISVFDKTLTAIDVGFLFSPDKFKLLCEAEVTKLNADQKDLWRAHYFAHFVNPIKKSKAERRHLLLKKAKLLDTVQELMVMEERSKPRASYILDRGQYDAYREQVYASTPSAILPMDPTLPKNRLGLAKWLFSPEHPLTARVAVNRYWQLLMGRGIVKTAEDFGNQGSLPTHPQLLDWLAMHFSESGWDVKLLLKLIVLSSTYQQSSQATEEKLRDDPENIYYSRGPSDRLAAEMLRDQALAASGLLDDRIGGQSVYPYQPDDLWKVNGGQYRAPEKDQVYRRSLYTIWKRSVPHPTQSTFDAPDRNECQPRRQKTTTPLQALVLMNDPTFVEASRELAQEILKVDAREGITKVFVRLTGRQPAEMEMNLLLELREKEILNFQENPRKLEGWLNAGLSNSQESNRVMLAANTVVASTIMNMDASLIKR